MVAKLVEVVCVCWSVRAVTITKEANLCFTRALQLGACTRQLSMLNVQNLSFVFAPHNLYFHKLMTFFFCHNLTLSLVYIVVQIAVVIMMMLNSVFVSENV
jgi:hypothetical protein